MDDIQQKLEDYLNSNDDDIGDFLPDEDTALMDKMMEFIMDLDMEALSEDQASELTEIINEMADSDIDEAFSARKVKIKPQEKRKRRMEYRRQRASIKMKAKKFRRTTKFKRYKRVKERKNRQGKTSTGKRIRKFL